MDNNRDDTRSGSTLREFSFAALAFSIMLLGLWGANKLQQSGRLTGDMAFLIKDFLVYIARISLVLLTVWLYKSIGFPRTIGPDFKSRFNRGWRDMDDKEATKWMIIVFLGLFIGGVLLMTKS